MGERFGSGQPLTKGTPARAPDGSALGAVATGGVRMTAGTVPGAPGGAAIGRTGDLGYAEPPAPPPARDPMQSEPAILGHVSSTMAAPADAIAGLLQAQLASGLWGAGDDVELCARATARALVQLLRAGVGAAHPIHGAQVKKAIQAARKLAARLDAEPGLRELLLAAAWLLAESRRLRDELARDLAVADEPILRRRVDELAAGL
jgi:Ca-activated chloride channel family protein